MNPNFKFWKMAYEKRWCSIMQLNYVVITDENPWGQITKDEYKEICGFDYPNME